MCSIDILESMVSISSIINKLSLDRFELFNKNNLMLLGKVEFASSEGKEKHDVKLSEPDDDIYNSVKDVFLKIISLTSKDDSPAIRESVHKYLSLLGNVISGFIMANCVWNVKRKTAKTAQLYKKLLFS